MVHLGFLVMEMKLVTGYQKESTGPWKAYMSHPFPVDLGIQLLLPLQDSCLLLEMGLLVFLVMEIGLVSQYLGK
ncbi:uncharacterized protein M6B38_406650 [Iris pallida]|uniref:Uncharacterized protein n=1 Tax=Iris pallida TaxID=29817 RepID=A0AAX6FQE5_IRIPA|nr:uncharacterized protein M6B38_406650 [Iris pallida]